MKQVLKRLETLAYDVRHFGLPVLARLVRRADGDGRTQVSTRFGPFCVRPAETDMEVLRQVFIDREYDLDRFPQGGAVRAAYGDILGRGKRPLIIDAGANAGFAARFFARAWPEARIISVEPDPGNAALCRVNTCALPQVEVVEAAIGARPGQVTLERNSGHAWAVRTHRVSTGLDVGGEAGAGPPVVTINQLSARVPNAELLIVKVDIEGFELDLFSCGTEWVAQAHAVIAEPHDWMLPGQGTSQTLQRAMLGTDRDMLISGENLIWVKR